MKILLGKLKKESGTSAAGELIYLSKHSWDCGWYWGFGYVGNNNCHFHFDGLLYPKGKKGETLCLASEIFESTNISDRDWWVIRDLFVQAYALKSAAEAYRHGGHQSSRAGVTDVIQNLERADQINADLKVLLDTAWEYVCKAVKKEQA